MEEAPSSLSLEKSSEIREKARIAAKAVDYSNAGTVEFLMDKNTQEFYFMEMNTRLQVEHPVSEMVSGLDLVELQLRIANGENIAEIMGNINKPQGHAIEARICAEDWFNGFLPQFGKIQKFDFDRKTVQDLRENISDYNFELISEKGARGERSGGYRADLGFSENSEVSRFYDSMIGKLIVWGETRQESLQKLEKMLDSFHLMGLETNIPFIRGVLKQPKFKDFSYSLDFFSEVQDHIISSQGKNPFENVHVVAAYVSEVLKLGNNRLASFRTNHGFKKYLILKSQRAFARDAQKEIEVEVSEIDKDKNEFSLTVFDSLTNQILHSDIGFAVSQKNSNKNQYDIRIYENELSSQESVSFEFFNEKCLLHSEGQFWEFENVTLRSPENAEEQIFNKKILTCPMSGIISKILVSEGQIIKKGQPVLSVEAMKMEHQIFAGFDLEIVELNCSEGQFVDLGQVVVKIKEI